MTNLTEPSPISMFTPPACRLLGGMLARRMVKKPQDRVFGRDVLEDVLPVHPGGAS
ncbi:MAG: hypothetical protein U0800_19555 [Isosphaeraceae bacterium]